MSNYEVYLLSASDNLPLNHPSNYVETTKYSFLSFIPKSVFFQFCRLANFYFLLTAILQSIPGYSPVNPLTAIGPLVLVLVVAMIKEAIEDLWESQWTEVEWQSIRPGDLLKVYDKQEFAADLLLLKSSDLSGDCKVQTSNLDGEVTLKTKQALAVTSDLFVGDLLKPLHSKVKVNVNAPCYGLSTFSGNIEIDSKTWVDHRQLLLRGSNLKNTEFIIGMVVYAGHETKIMMNQRTTPFKRSHFEDILNKIVIFQLVLQTGMCIYLAISSVSFENDHRGSPYSDLYTNSNGFIGSTAYFSYFILLNSLIPISMIVSLELVKFLQTFFVEMDLKMYSKTENRTAKVQSMSILEELGSINYIFCDKTGTLTANVMEFKGCNIAGVTYSASLEQAGPEHLETLRNMIRDPNEDQVSTHEIHQELSLAHNSCKIKRIEVAAGKVLETHADFIDEFLCSILLCNEIVTDKSSDSNKFLSSSPDEIALIKAALHFGYEFIERNHMGIVAKVGGTHKFFEVLALNEFTPERKRMSVLVKHPDDALFRLYVKGADEAIGELLDRDKEIEYLNDANAALVQFAETGLRTLNVAFKIVQNPHDWLQKYSHEKCNFSEKQKENLEKLAAEIEKDLILLGITAVEDKLQKSVEKAINEFNAAEIKVWMITGDKLETAENIGYSCNLIKKHWRIFHIRSNIDIADQLLSISNDVEKAKLKQKTIDFAIIIEGDSLAKAIESQRKLFYKVCSECNSVICCRANPKQKAKVVNFIRKMDPRAKTLAIGDGGNDTSMIQCAHIGIGIYGKEGHQAADCSDFAICEFRFLRTLLFVHGRWNSRRIGFFILYFFFKNIAFTLVQGYFAFLSGFSGQTIWDDWYLLLFNSAITAAGIVCYSLWDQDVNCRLDPEVKKFWPVLYKDNRENLPLTVGKYLVYLVWGIFCSLIVFLFGIFSFSPILNSRGFVEVMWDMSVSMYTSVIFSVSVILIINMKYWTWIQHLVIWGLGFVLYCPVFMFIYDQVPGTYVYLSTADFLSLFNFWACVFIVTAITTIPYYFVLIYSEIFHPSPADLVFQKRYSAKGTHGDEKLINESVNKRQNTGITNKQDSA